MGILIAILLGMVQGITEFLPISSSGHLVLLQRIFGITNNVLLFDIILHLGTLVAVMFVYRKQLLELVKKPFSKKVGYLALSTIITLAIAFLFNDFFENAFGGGLLAFGFMVTATLLLIAQFISTKYTQTKKEVGFKNAGVAGVFQGLAIMPGISRSGSTISSLIASGVDKEKAAEFSFMLSIPIICAGLVYEVLKNPVNIVALDFLPTLLGFVFSVLFGVLAIKFMLKIIKEAKWWVFSVYLVVLSLIILLNDTMFFWF